MGAIRGSGWGPRDGEGGGARGMAGGGKTSERGNNGFVPLRRRMFAKRRSREDGAVLGVISEGVNWSRRRLQLIEGKGTTYCAGAGKPECTLLIPSKLPRLEKNFTTRERSNGGGNSRGRWVVLAESGMVGLTGMSVVVGGPNSFLSSPLVQCQRWQMRIRCVGRGMHGGERASDG